MEPENVNDKIVNAEDIFNEELYKFSRDCFKAGQESNEDKYMKAYNAFDDFREKLTHSIKTGSKYSKPLFMESTVTVAVPANASVATEPSKETTISSYTPEAIAPAAPVTTAPKRPRKPKEPKEEKKETSEFILESEINPEDADRCIFYYVEMISPPTYYNKPLTQDKMIKYLGSRKSTFVGSGYFKIHCIDFTGEEGGQESYTSDGSKRKFMTISKDFPMPDISNGKDEIIDDIVADDDGIEPQSDTHLSPDSGMMTAVMPAEEHLDDYEELRSELAVIIPRNVMNEAQKVIKGVIKDRKGEEISEPLRKNALIKLCDMLLNSNKIAIPALTMCDKLKDRGDDAESLTVLALHFVTEYIIEHPNKNTKKTYADVE